MSLLRYTRILRLFCCATAAGFGALLLSHCTMNDAYDFELSPRIRQEIDFCTLRSICNGEDLASCMLALPEGGVSRSTWPGYPERREGCVATAKSCAEYQQCDSGTSNVGACDPESFEARCEGDQLFACEPVEGATHGIEVKTDCTTSGQRCLAGASGAKTCGWPVACDAGCDGKTIYHCSKRREVPLRLECARPGQTCDPDGPDCVDELQPKTPCSTPHCDGTKMVGCANGKTATVDCATLHPHVTCRMLNGRPRCGVHQGATECDPYTDLGTCHGSLATICVAGRHVSVDCSRTLGATCVHDERGTGVRCATPPGAVAPSSENPSG